MSSCSDTESLRDYSCEMLEPRKKRALDPFLDKKLAAYTLAGAASLGALAVSPAEAAIVYTSAKESGNTYKQLPVIYSIDLNHDGIVDFQLIANGTLAPNSVGSKFESVNVALYGMNHNSVALVPSAESSFAKKAKVREGGKQDAPQLVFVPPAEALAFGSEVAPQLEFGNGGFLVQLVSIGLSSAGGGGEFCNQRNKFLGLRLRWRGKFTTGGLGSESKLLEWWRRRVCAWLPIPRRTPLWRSNWLITPTRTSRIFRFWLAKASLTPKPRCLILPLRSRLPVPA